MISPIAELANHAMRLAEQDAGAKSGKRYADALSAQCKAFRGAADLLEAETLKALLELSNTDEVQRQ